MTTDTREPAGLDDMGAGLQSFMQPPTAPEAPAELYTAAERKVVYKAYAGIGRRETPLHILEVMGLLASTWAQQGWTLRSGKCPEGADAAFEAGHDAGRAVDPEAPLAELYTPADVEALKNRGDQQLYEQFVRLWSMAKEAHPAWARCSPRAQLLLMRSILVVLGPHPVTDPIPATFVCFWHDGTEPSGTGQALRYALKWNAGAYTARKPDWQIDFRNLYELPVLERALAFLELDREHYRARWGLNADLSNPAPAAVQRWPGVEEEAEAAAAPAALAPPAPAVAVPEAPPVFVWGVGHGANTVAELIRRLFNHGITLVVDARPPGAGPVWHDAAELEENLHLNHLEYQPSPKLASDDPAVRGAGVQTLVGYARAHPDQRVCVLEAEIDARKQARLNALFPLVRAAGVYPRRILRDGTDAPA